MTDLTPVATLSPVVQLETTDRALAGTGNPMNRQAQALLNRDAFRAAEIAANAAAAAAAAADVVVLRQDLAHDTDPAKGSGQVAHNPAQPYASDTVGGALNALARAMAVDVLQEGAVADGVTDDSAAFISARTKAAITGKFVYAPAGTYKLNSAVTSSEDLRIVGDGDSTVLDFTGTVTGGNYALEALGTATQIEELSGSQAEGSNTVLFVSPPSLAIGDVFVIFNPTASSWSAFRTEYFAGEWCEVESISGNTVITKSPLYDTYAAAAVDVYKVTGPSVHLRDIKVVGTTVTGLMHPQFCINPLFENVTGEHANNSVIYPDRCYGVTIDNPNIKNVGDGGDDYGISIGNSQHVRVNGGSIYSRRHSVTHGGGSGICSVPNRDSRIIGSALKNDTASGVHNADFHGNSEDCYFVGCDISGGATFQGKNVGYINCNISNLAAGHVVQASEVKGGKHSLINCNLSTYIDPQPGGRGIVNYDAGITGDTTERVLLEIKDCKVYGRNLTASTYFARFVFRGSVAPIDTDFNGIDFNVNTLGTIFNTSYVSGTAASNGTSILNLTGNLPAGVTLLSPGLTSLAGLPLRMPRLSGSEVLTTSTSAAFVSGTPVVFKYAYPKKPTCGCTATERGVAGNRVPMGMANPVSTSGLTPQVLSSDGVNFSAAVTVTANWFAELAEF